MSTKKNHVCPVEKAKFLSSKVRRLVQNPKKILQPYITEGMTVMDLGCGPGFFIIDMAKLAGNSGKVIAADLQEEMLSILKNKISNTEFQDRVILHKCQQDKIGIADKMDFVLAFYIVHEIPDKEKLFKEIASILKPMGKMLIVEPPFHVSKEDFEDCIKIASGAGLRAVERPRIFFSQAVILQKV